MRLECVLILYEVESASVFSEYLDTYINYK